MFVLNIQVITVVTLIILNLSIANGWFERNNYQVNLQANAVFPLKSPRYQRKSSTRIVFVGPVNTTLSLICHINYSTGCRRGTIYGTQMTRRGRCCDDYFYVGFNLDPNIRGAIRYCNRWDDTDRPPRRGPITATSLPTTGQPVLVVATSATRFGRYGEHKCYISSTDASGATTTSTPKPKPDPNNPDPDNQPDPDNPDPDNQPDPDNPDPDNQPDPDNPDPDNAEPDNAEPDNAEPDNADANRRRKRLNPRTNNNSRSNKKIVKNSKKNSMRRSNQ